MYCFIKFLDCFSIKKYNAKIKISLILINAKTGFKIINIL